MEVIIIKLDYSLQSPEERCKLVEKILEENPNPSDKYLETMADYLVLSMEKAERKKRKILTENRMTTVNKRETSFEGLVEQFENGEDGVYGIITEDRHIIFQPKVMITKQDVEDIPLLRQVREAIKIWEELLKEREGREAFLIKRAIIDLRKDQYIIKNAYRRPITPNKITQSKNYTPLDDSFSFDKDGFLIPEGVSLANYKVCSVILRFYSTLKQEGHGNFERDLYYLMEDFDRIATKALKHYPIYEKIIEYKIDGKSNPEIQMLIQQEFGIKHSMEYISNLWRNKIPKLIASEAEDELLQGYYLNNERGIYKKCTKCGQIKLAHNKYFSKNKTSKDSFYSICKNCRNATDGPIVRKVRT